MKITIIGGGSHRLLAILLGAMSIPDVLDGGEISLYDLNVVRSEAVGRLLLKTPEQARGGCRVTWGATLEESLQGADVVGVIMPASAPKAFALSDEACARHGFISSDNISPTGALCAVNVAPILMKIARTMEKVCPNAWLLDFVNPVAVISGMVNNHTSIRALGVCAGFTNHLWDLPRIIEGTDAMSDKLVVESAGVNHIGYIMNGSWDGENLFDVLNRVTGPDWRPPTLQPWRNESSAKNVMNSVSRLVRIWRELGVMVFSSEPDGMDHLQYAEAVELLRQRCNAQSATGLDAALAQRAAAVAEGNRTFEAWVDQDLDAKFWAEHWREDQRFGCDKEDIFVRIFAALAGVKEAKIATSRLNNGAIKGIKDRHVVEYTQYMLGNEIRPAGVYEIPDIVQGLTSGLAAHQTMLGDALAVEDPELLAKALISYPVQPYSAASRSLFKELLALHDDRITPALKRTAQFL